MAEEGGAAGAGAKTSSKYFGVISHEAVSPVTDRQTAVHGVELAVPSRFLPFVPLQHMVLI